jgi:hypothetical protein
VAAAVVRRQKRHPTAVAIYSRMLQCTPEWGAHVFHDGLEDSGTHPTLRLQVDRLPRRKIVGHEAPRVAGSLRYRASR